jgi:hypothetical protein
MVRHCAPARCEFCQDHFAQKWVHECEWSTSCKNVGRDECVKCLGCRRLVEASESGGVAALGANTENSGRVCQRSCCWRLPGKPNQNMSSDGFWNQSLDASQVFRI